MHSVILQFPGSIYAMETRNPGPMYANKFFQLLFCKIEDIHKRWSSSKQLFTLNEVHALL